MGKLALAALMAATMITQASAHCVRPKVSISDVSSDRFETERRDYYLCQAAEANEKRNEILERQTKALEDLTSVLREMQRDPRRTR